jgi:hypothetical protein
LVGIMHSKLFGVVVGGGGGGGGVCVCVCEGGREGWGGGG